MDNILKIIGVFSTLLIAFYCLFILLPNLYISRSSKKDLPIQNDSFILKPSKLNLLLFPIIESFGILLMIIAIKAILDDILNVFAVQGIILLSILSFGIGIQIVKKYLNESIVITNDFIKMIHNDNEIITIYWKDIKSVTYNTSHFLVLESKYLKIEVKESYEGFLMLIKALQSNVDQSIYIDAFQMIESMGRYLKDINNLIEN